MTLWLQKHPRIAVTLLATILAVAGFVGCTGNFGAVTVTTSGSGSSFLSTGRTNSHFQALQVDPRSEDSAGPQFVVAADLNGDGLMDLVSAWNQSQPVQIHLQRRNAAGVVGFETVTLAGNVPVVSVAGLAVADMDRDGALDIVVLVKDSLEPGSACLDSEQPSSVDSAGVVLIYLAPALKTQVTQPLAWTEAPIEKSLLTGTAGDGINPENGGFTSMAVGDVDGDGAMDVVVAWNSICGGTTGTQAVLLFTNQGHGAVRDRSWEVTVIPNDAPIGTTVKDLALGDIDADGDLDIVATFPDAKSENVRWFRNPAIDIVDDYHISNGLWQVGTVGQIPTGADTIRVADVDGDGLLDVITRSTNGKLIQWLKGPGPEAITSPLPNVPWQVYTLAEFTDRTPEAIAFGNISGDSKPELVASASGELVWFNAESGPTIYDEWGAVLIIDEGSQSSSDPNATTSTATGIRSILIVDLDGDGQNDIVATFDRAGLSGIANDALVWFRNTQ
ncbi:MAG: VCBS repeat-containing protein [Planctomycetes bacterium]|nr:VCBS repeat-containing protein [Planctomycetota bacterium]